MSTISATVPSYSLPLPTHNIFFKYLRPFSANFQGIIKSILLERKEKVLFTTVKKFQHLLPVMPFPGKNHSNRVQTFSRLTAAKTCG